MNSLCGWYDGEAVGARVRVVQTDVDGLLGV